MNAVSNFQKWLAERHPELLTDDGLVDISDPDESVIPDSRVDENGIRHAIIWEIGDDNQKYLLRTKDGWTLKQRTTF